MALTKCAMKITQMTHIWTCCLLKNLAKYMHVLACPGREVYLQCVVSWQTCFSTRAMPSCVQAMALTHFCYPKRVLTRLSYVYSCCSPGTHLWGRESLQAPRNTQCWLLMIQDYIQAQRYITFEACPATKRVLLFRARKFREVAKQAFGEKVVAEKAGALHYAM